MARPKGQPKLGGRQKGTPNKTTVEARQAMANLVQENVYKFSIWLDEIYDQHGAKAAWDSLMDAVEFHVPKLSRTELTGAGGGDIKIQTTSSDDEIITRALTQLGASQNGPSNTKSVH